MTRAAARIARDHLQRRTVDAELAGFARGITGDERARSKRPRVVLLRVAGQLVHDRSPRAPFARAICAIGASVS
jgi:hypothetical protein